MDYSVLKTLGKQTFPLRLDYRLANACRCYSGFSEVSFLVFMWVKRFCGSHKTASDGNCILRLQRFSTPVSVWDAGFSPHPLHSSMQNPPQCAYKSMQRLFFSPQETKQNSEISIYIGVRSAKTEPFFMAFKTASTSNAASTLL